MKSLDPDKDDYQSPATCKGSKPAVKACQQEIFHDVAAECFLKIFSCLQDAKDAMQPSKIQARPYITDRPLNLSSENSDGYVE